MAQDRCLEFTQCRRRFQAKLFPKLAAELTVGLEGFGLPTTAVEGEHELTAKALPQGMVSHHPAQLCRERTRRAQSQVRFVALLQASQLQVFQPGNLGLRERIV